MFLFQTPGPTTTKYVDKVLEITPAGLGGYGLALTVLVVIAYVFHKNWKDTEAENRVQAQKLLDFALNMSALLTRVQQRLDDTKDNDTIKREILRIVENNNRLLEELRK